ncbi:MAG: hypothetical protein K9L62_16460 [Vallitaleaceae bacterium]|nr:hypothetical protein [Vallitaleaceae bacterium]
MKKIIVAVIVVLVMLIYLIPRKIEKEITLAKVQYDNLYVASEAEIYFNGYRYNRLFQDPIFKGNIKLDDTTIERTQFVLNDIDPLIGSINSSEDFITFGSIYLAESFDEVTILLNEEGHWSISEGILLTGPVFSREEAVEMINKHFASSRLSGAKKFK